MLPASLDTITVYVPKSDDLILGMKSSALEALAMVIPSFFHTYLNGRSELLAAVIPNPELFPISVLILVSGILMVGGPKAMVGRPPKFEGHPKVPDR
jgi:hypothetical protein